MLFNLEINCTMKGLKKRRDILITLYIEPSVIDTRRARAAWRQGSSCADLQAESMKTGLEARMRRGCWPKRRRGGCRSRGRRGGVTRNMYTYAIYVA